MIRIGFIGLGHNGRAHVRTHQELGASEVAALCDCNEALLHEAAAELGVARTHASAEELCAQDDVDAVSIHTGDPFHKGPFLAAVRSGKHVFVEKPLANTIEDVEAMVKAARAAAPSLKIAVGYVLRFNPVFEAVRELCRSGKLGDIFYLEGDYVHNLLCQANQTDAATGVNWYLEHEKPIVGGGSHPLDLLRWFTGAEIVEAAGCSTGIGFPDMNEDDTQVALFRFDSGAVAKVAAVYAPRMEMASFYNLRVYGTRGTVERDQAALAKDEDDYHPVFRPIEAPRLDGHPYEPEVGDWLEAIEDDRPPRCDLFDGANSTMATLVAAKAMAEGRTLPVPVFSRDSTADARG